MKSLRILLCLSVLAVAYSAGLMIALYPQLGIGLGVLAIAALGRKGVQYTAHGTARWADASDLGDMIDG
jgi:hypothetical protein